jgi:hypothetical protein
LSEKETLAYVEHLKNVVFQTDQEKKGVSLRRP